MTSRSVGSVRRKRSNSFWKKNCERSRWESSATDRHMVTNTQELTQCCSFQSQNSKKVEDGVPAKRTFLKRGEGVARFGVNGKPPPPKPRRPKPGSKPAISKHEASSHDRPAKSAAARKVASSAHPAGRALSKSTAKKQDEQKKAHVKQAQKSVLPTGDSTSEFSQARYVSPFYLVCSKHRPFR